MVEGRRRGREVVYSLADEHLAHIVLDAVAHAEESGGEPATAPCTTPLCPPAMSDGREGR